MYSIFHFWVHLFRYRSYFNQVKSLEEFPFDEQMLSCRNKGIFPDMAIKLSRNGQIFEGGELIELKDNRSYSVSSFNSTIPAGTKDITTLISSKNSNIRAQMEHAGDDINSLPIRSVYYLIRGKNKNNIKVCLTHGSFFETIQKEDLIIQSFLQVIEERTNKANITMPDDLKRTISSLFTEQEIFSRTRDIEKASVKIRFRVMTEVKAEGNILNSKKYPEILDNSLNFVIPYKLEIDEKDHVNKMKQLLTDDEFSALKIFKIKHHFNGFFLVIQSPIN